jgi:epsilon-lactone hydrolase
MPLSGAVIMLMAILGGRIALGEVDAPHAIPTRALPIPNTVSPALQRLIEQSPTPHQEIPRTIAEWRALEAAAVDRHELSQELSQELAEVQARFGVTVTPQMLGGVSCYLISPKEARSGGRLLLSLHGGGWISGADEAGLFESIVMAGVTGYKVIEVNYRLLPDYPFPAALDDLMSVWREIIRGTKASDVAFFGSSVGGSMVLSAVQRARKEGLPVPAAVMSGSPWADLSKTGDSYYTNDGVDWITYDGFWEAVAKLYANGRDLKDPLLSPVYGDFSGFPPVFLVSGTRDVFLSNTVRVQHRLLEAGIPVQLEIEEGQPHMAYVYAAMAGAPEDKELYIRIGRFFAAHLGHR